MSRQRPTDPLVVVLGSTGTGKSDLAVELARRFNGEIINADAMQMYHGLPVTTNKISVAEQRGVPHHLLGTIALHEPTWRVDHFKKEASRIIADIRGRGRLPIVVGGSQYYTDGLLFDDILVEGEFDRAGDEGDNRAEDADADEESFGDTGDREKEFPILAESTERLYAELQRVDPVIAMRWHPRDRRRIVRSLEIFLQTGRRTSDIYAEQKTRREEKLKAESGFQPRGGDANTQSSWNTLMFWVYAQPDVLNARLDGRIDTMQARGLEQETSAMYDTLRDYEARGTPIDKTKGIWQSIGYKEMEPYVKAVKEKQQDVDIDALRTAGLDGIKFGTRRYARYQLRWIKHKTIPCLQDAHPRALDHLFLLDSTDKSAWHENVAEVGVSLAAKFLGESPDGEIGGEPVESLPAPMDVSERARTVLHETIHASRGTVFNAEKPFKQTCVVCNVTTVSEEQWTKHVRGSRHRRVVQKHKRRALVPADIQERLAAEKTARWAERGWTAPTPDSKMQAVSAGAGPQTQVSSESRDTTTTTVETKPEASPEKTTEV
ncbi:trna isopentenyltransferase [Ophiostoma piceae UAMH 11346]|uniref:Trna isopentenyltransferase n=1 Tax=Ophiostoma piceae (strain UAMH 11346) TaxID=1262450 RepID=S3C120_OPHP1|nr:trna isopentenyltransferase [Ophiostoma piceae UAMH 11346]